MYKTIKYGNKKRKINFVLFGNEVKKIRKSKGMTIAELSELTGLADQSISSIENGAHVSLENALKIARVLNISLDKLKLVDRKFWYQKNEEIMANDSN